MGWSKGGGGIDRRGEGISGVGSRPNAVNRHETDV